MRNKSPVLHLKVPCYTRCDVGFYMDMGSSPARQAGHAHAKGHWQDARSSKADAYRSNQPHENKLSWGQSDGDIHALTLSLMPLCMVSLSVASMTPCMTRQAFRQSSSQLFQMQSEQDYCTQASLSDPLRISAPLHDFASLDSARQRFPYGLNAALKCLACEQFQDHSMCHAQNTEIRCKKAASATPCMSTSSTCQGDARHQSHICC